MKKNIFQFGRDYVHPQLTEFAVNAETVICGSVDTEDLTQGEDITF